MPKAKILILSPSSDGLLHYGGRAWRSDGNVGHHYMVQGSSMWHIQSLRKDGSLEYGNLLLPAGPLHPHIRTHRTVNHHAQHLQARPHVDQEITVSTRALEPQHYSVVSTLSVPAPMQVEAAGTEAEQKGWSEKWETFHDQHARGIMRTQGIVDIAAGSVGTVGTVGAVVMLLAPETMGLSLVFGIAALATYEIFRNGTQVAAGMVEVTASYSEDDKHLLETREQIDHLKTVISAAGLATMGAYRISEHRTAWKEGLIASDMEAVGTGWVMPDPFEEVFPLQRLARAAGASKTQKGLALAQRAGELADKVDKVHASAGDALQLQHNVRQLLAQQQRQRNKNNQPATTTGQHP